MISVSATTVTSTIIMFAVMPSVPDVMPVTPARTLNTVTPKSVRQKMRPSGSRLAQQASLYSRTQGISAFQPLTPDFSSTFHTPAMYSALSAACQRSVESSRIIITKLRGLSIGTTFAE